MGLENVAMNFEHEVRDWWVNAQVDEDGAKMLASEKQELEYERETSQHSQACPGSQVADSAQCTKVLSQRQKHQEQLENLASTVGPMGHVFHPFNL